MRIFLFVLTLFFVQTSTAFELEADTFDDGDRLPLKHVFNAFGCEGKNISPELEWDDAPESTKSFAVTVYDPDAPTGSGWWHWVVFNIPANEDELDEGGPLPEGAIESRTDYGSTGFGGACPPIGHGDHRYIFTVYALNVAQLDLDENTPAAMVGYFLNQHKIDSASITAYYGR